MPTVMPEDQFDFRRSAINQRRWIFNKMSEQGLWELALERYNTELSELNKQQLIDWLLDKEFPNREQDQTEAH